MSLRTRGTSREEKIKKGQKITIKTQVIRTVVFLDKMPSNKSA